MILSNPTSRVSVLGQLASALAHELIQPLTATAANVDAAQMELESEEPDLEELRAILDDVERDMAPPDESQGVYQARQHDALRSPANT